MNYSLSSTRKVGEVMQKIITNFTNADGSQYSSSNVYNYLQAWHSPLASWDPTGVTSGTIAYSNLAIDENSSGSDNTGVKGHVIATVQCSRFGYPKSFSIEVDNVTNSTVGATLAGAILRSAGLNIVSDTSGVTITNVLIDLHN